MLRQYENKKKYVYKKYDNNDRDWREGLEDLINLLDSTKKQLLQIEVELMEDLENSFKDFENNLNNFLKEIGEIIKPAFVKI